MASVQPVLVPVLYFKIPVSVWQPHYVQYLRFLSFSSSSPPPFIVNNILQVDAQRLVQVVEELLVEYEGHT